MTIYDVLGVLIIGYCLIAFFIFTFFMSFILDVDFPVEIKYSFWKSLGVSFILIICAFFISCIFPISSIFIKRWIHQES